MTPLNRFRDLLGTYGADPRRWPPAERALLLLGNSAEAEALRREAAALDSLLDQAPRPVAPRIDAAVLAALITARPQEAYRRHERLQDMLWLRAVGLAAAALIGFVVGTTQLTDIGDSSASAAPIDVADVAPW
jgi:hypothetical protein